MDEKIEQSQIVQEQPSNSGLEDSHEQGDNYELESNSEPENDNEQGYGYELESNSEPENNDEQGNYYQRRKRSWILRLRDQYLHISYKVHSFDWKKIPKLKWFYFLIYIALFANTLLILFNVVPTLLGYNQSDNTTYVYSLYPSLKGVDLSYNILLIGVAVLSIITRQYLAYRRVVGIHLLYYIYAVNMVLPVIYIITTSIILKASTLTSSIFLRVIVCVIMIVLNMVYFKKRRNLFH